MTLTKSPLTQSLGQFVADLSPNRLPEEAARIARMGFIDTIGTMIAGRNEDSVRIMTETLAPGDGPATLTFGDRKAPAPEAAWINGTAAHALDYDDVALRGHPSTVLVPAILAEAEHLGSSGADMITAYVAGYETWAELFRRDTGLLHQKGWHPTGLYGAVGAAAACAKLRKLDAEKSAIAIALGASQSSGLMSNFGTMTKPFHAGKAAHAGIMAARLAEAGFTANTDALEHPQGFLHAISPTGTEDRTSHSKAGSEWAILTQGLGIKKYPTCYCTHRAIDCMLDLVNTSPIKADDVEKITVEISDYFSTVLRNHQPDTGLAAKFSIEFCMASGIVAQRVGLRELTDEFVQRPDIRALMKKVEIVTTSTYDADLPGAAPHDQVTVTLADGSRIAGDPVARATGHPSRPLTDQQLYDKFVDCLDAGASPIPADVLFKRLSAIQSINARDLTSHAGADGGVTAVAIGRRIILGSALAAPFIRTAAADPIKLRVSLDTSPSHGRTISIADFLKKLEAASQGQIAPQLFDSGQLFPDRDVIKALVLGQVEMAAPGTWLVAAYVPEADMSQLPVFYGQPLETTHRAIDGIPGEMANEQITRKLRVKIPGRWIDLGFTNWYSTRRSLNTLADLKGLKIRSSGGFAQPWRARFFGAVPNVTAWPDVPLALSQGTFDAIQSTNESCASAKLWDAGLHFALIDHQSMGDYIPMIGEAFWAALTPSLKSLVTDLWAANIGIYRANLAAAQDRAEKELKARGLRLTYVSPDDLAEARKLMLAEQETVAREMKISTDMLTRISEAIVATN